MFENVQIFENINKIFAQEVQANSFREDIDVQAWPGKH